MAHQFKNSRSRLSGGARLGLAVLVFWALAVPAIYMSRSAAVQADEKSENPAASEEPVPTQAAAAPSVTYVGPVLEVVPLPNENERKIEAELEKPTALDFQETPLQGVVDYLRNKHQIEIQLDDKALTDAGVDPETQVTRSLKGISLRSALRQLLSQYELAAIIQDELLLITTTEKASTCLVTRTYPVGDLVADDNYGDLFNAITETIRPLTWEEGGGEGRLVAMKNLKSLVISQTQEVHDEILHLLRSLRAVGKAVAVSSK